MIAEAENLATDNAFKADQAKEKKKGVSFLLCEQQWRVDKRLVSRDSGPKDARLIQTKKKQEHFLLQRDI